MVRLLFTIKRLTTKTKVMTGTMLVKLLDVRNTARIPVVRLADFSEILSFSF